MCQITTYKGVIDRFSNDLAVILIEEINKEMTVTRSTLPTGAQKGTWLTIEKVKNSYQIIAIDQQKTTSETKKTDQLMNKLKGKKRESQFKRK